MFTDMLLYHISVYPLENPHTFCPRIPSGISPYEDHHTPRICFAPSIKQAITATGYNLKENNTIYFAILDTNTIPTKHIVFPKTLYEQKAVPDVYLTEEHWITCPVTLPTHKAVIQQISYEIDHNTDILIAKDVILKADG